MKFIKSAEVIDFPGNIADFHSKVSCRGPELEYMSKDGPVPHEVVKEVVQGRRYRKMSARYNEETGTIEEEVDLDIVVGATEEVRNLIGLKVEEWNAMSANNARLEQMGSHYKRRSEMAESTLWSFQSKPLYKRLWLAFTNNL